MAGAAPQDTAASVCEAGSFHGRRAHPSGVASAPGTGKRHRRNHREEEMSYRIAAGVALALIASTPALQAQGVRMDRNISMDLASAIMAAAMDRCSKDGYQVSVAVVDRAGQMVAFLRADVIALGGGLPIAVGDDTIGGVGVSGAPGQEKDEACA